MKVLATVEVLLSLIMHHYKSVMRQVGPNIKDIGRFLQRSERTRCCSTLAETLTGKKDGLSGFKQIPSDVQRLERERQVSLYTIQFWSQDFILFF